MPESARFGGRGAPGQGTGAARGKGEGIYYELNILHSNLLKVEEKGEEIYSQLNIQPSIASE